ncbi:MAG: alanine--tRNA ligase [Actinomycetota bacterium]|nr:alanine--tRNA ligase [Actinomycetota bacterium]
MEANTLRKAFTDFFESRGHTLVPSASLIPHDPTVLFTVAGMVPFKPYFLGEEQPPFSRATTIQKCMRAGGKHNDLDQIGRTARHLTFFEMMGNFSFGDYFKRDAIPFAWELVTKVLGLDKDRLWVTVHLSDDEAEAIWRDEVGVDPSRIQRLDEDNWWQMADTGPCGPCSEIYFDKGEQYGADGGPALGSDERFLEIWNLVFMQYDRGEDGTLSPLPKPCIDTGAGLERILPVMQGKGSVYETDLLWPILTRGAEITGVKYGDDEETDVSLRIMADHARSMTFLVGDGVIPSNEGRGYVLRRIIRRAALRAWRIREVESVLIQLVDVVIEKMGEAYPEIVAAKDFITKVIDREEQNFARTLRAGSAQLDLEMEKGAISGQGAFRLHDTYGFPIELTMEIASDRGVSVDIEAFDLEMSSQRERARSDRKGKVQDSEVADRYREILETFGTTSFTGYTTTSSHGRIIGVVENGKSTDVFTDTTCFYAEQGGQVGDNGSISTDSGVAKVVDTVFVLPSLICHRVEKIEGQIRIGQVASLEVDEVRREKIRKNHTATHLLHAVLRETLGDHVKQQGSLVAPDRLRFDFFHWGPMSPSEIAGVERSINAAIADGAKVSTEVTSKSNAMEMGAIAFFGDKYGDEVRVVRAGSKSLEFCGGTHVSDLASIGLFVVVSEASIGSNTRRIEALTSLAAYEYLKSRADTLNELNDVMAATDADVIKKVEALRAKERELSTQIAARNSERIAEIAQKIVKSETNSSVVWSGSGLTSDLLRELYGDLMAVGRYGFVALFSTTPDGKVAIIAGRSSEFDHDVSVLMGDVARTLGGGVGRNADFVQSGGKFIDKVDEAVALLRDRLTELS